MKVISLTHENAHDALSEAEAAIRSGEILILPTDTVYGIAGSAKDERAIKKAFSIKKRPEEKAFPVFVESIPAARRIANISDVKARFLESVWPGPVTVVFDKKEILPAVLTGMKNTIGIRIPDYPFLAKLLSFFDFPLFQTSANISSLPPARTKQDVFEYFGEANPKIALFVDAGNLSGAPSTVIDYTSDHPIILRSGHISKAELDRLLGL
ncbi:MAG: hypothetical protein UY78_C0021G0002 [Parcubacteria group bacterium GW2011_GWA1_53_13]|uniref:L-threonylcarbamoyladenylate synthase n=1 Tax=Candidatus Adlerbacteria bacterium GW2011_GWC1_50_9 TaxID=1618608 RepID=A0A0G1WJN6_9BACT|nr:MAG: hypothetical protein UY61_C0074G0008 [Candidatus Adlerbacteria bacterium GW2011_GWC1_50_9]KKW33019.1 MAG: hypothetical protein UY78_C0021G0002 [Parcubacteria group bacterium GW2011_GWA1_53_13]